MSARRSNDALADELERFAAEVHEMQGGVFISSRMRESAERLRDKSEPRGIGFAFVLIKKFQELSSAAIPDSFEFNERGKQWLQEAYEYATALREPEITVTDDSLTARSSELWEPSDEEVERFFAMYSADVRYEPADHPRMIYLLGRALVDFVRNRREA